MYEQPNDGATMSYDFYGLAKAAGADDPSLVEPDDAIEMAKARILELEAQIDQATVDAWNAKYSDGQLVDVWPFIREGFQPKRAVQCGEALILGGHTAGIYVRPGGFMALTHVDAVVAEAVAGDEST